MSVPVSCWFTAETDRETLAENVARWIVAKACDQHGRTSYARLDEERDAFVAAITRHTDAVVLGRGGGR
jgi:hypothetical protein